MMPGGAVFHALALPVAATSGIDASPLWTPRLSTRAKPNREPDGDSRSSATPTVAGFTSDDLICGCS